MRPDLDRFPPALTTRQAALVLNLSPDALERAAKRGDAPVPHYRWGRALRWPREPILQLLGLTNGNGAPTEAPPGDFVTDRPDQELPNPHDIEPV